MPFKVNPLAVVKDVDTKRGVVRAYGSAFGNEDADGDIIDRGAYARTISDPGHRPRIKVLWQHDTWTPIGAPTELIEDEVGLLFTAPISKTTAGRDALILYADGVITEHSVRLSNIRRAESDRRHIIETVLWEISPVTWGANPMTPLLDLKSGDDLAAVHKRMLAQVHQAQAALKTGISDELGLRLESMLELWETQLQALAKGQAEPDPAAGREKALDELENALDELVKAAVLDLGILAERSFGAAPRIESEEDALRAILARLD